MNLKNVFSKLANKNDFRGLSIFADTLEKTGNFKIADKVTEYLKYCSLENIKTANNLKKYNYPQIEKELSTIFINMVNERTDQQMDFNDFAHDPKIMSILLDKDLKKNFKSFATQILSHKYVMPRESAKKFASKIWRTLVQDIVSNIPNFKNITDFMSIAEQIFKEHDMDLMALESLNPESSVFHYIFSKKSPLNKEIMNAVQDHFGPEKTKHIMRQIKDTIQENYYPDSSFNKGHQELQKSIKRREYGINNTDEKDLLYKAILSLGNPMKIFDPRNKESAEFFNDANLNKLRKFLESELSEVTFDDDERRHQIDRLIGGIIKAYKNNKEKYDAFILEQNNKKQENHDLGKQWAEDYAERQKHLRENIENDLSGLDPTKKWYQFWKTSCAEYDLVFG